MFIVSNFGVGTVFDIQREPASWIPRLLLTVSMTRQVAPVHPSLHPFRSIRRCSGSAASMRLHRAFGSYTPKTDRPRIPETDSERHVGELISPWSLATPDRTLRCLSCDHDEDVPQRLSYFFPSLCSQMLEVCPKPVPMTDACNTLP